MSSKSPNAPAQPQADAWFTPWRFAAILGLLMVVCFPLVLFGFETFFFRDFGCFGYPLAFYHRENFWRGEIPLWNPYHEFGLPFLAQWNTLTLYPLSLFYLIFPLSWSVGVFNLGHMFLAGIGMYFLAHRWTGNRFAAAVAGIVFAFNGLSWHALMWPNNIAALGWMPWVVLTMQMAWQSGGRAILKTALVATLQLLAGAPEIILLTWALLAVMSVAELRMAKIPRALLIRRFFFVWLLVVGLSAAQMFPFLDLLQHSHRGGKYFESELWPMPLSGWANFFMPLFHEVAQKGVYSQHTQFWTSSYYLGAGVMGLAALAAFFSRDKKAWYLTGTTFFFLVLALGRRAGLYWLLKTFLPGLGFMRYPIKFVMLATFTIPLLAAIGLNWFLHQEEKKWTLAQSILKKTGLAVLGIILACCAIEWFHPLLEDDRIGGIENAMVRVAFLLALFTTLIYTRPIREFKLQVLARICILLFLWFDVYTHEPNPNPTVERAVYEPDTIRQFFQWDHELRPGYSRAMENLPALTKISLEAARDPAADVNGRRLSLFADYNLLDHVSKVDGFYSLELPQANILIEEMFEKTNGSPKLEEFIGIEKISDPTNAVDWITRTNFMPMLTAGQEPLFADDDTLMSLLISKQFEPRQFVYLQPEWRGKILAKRGAATITAQTFENQKITATVKADGPAMLVIAQSYYHNWRAFVDDQPVNLLRANFAFQALEVPAGEHRVRLVYKDYAFETGAGISLASLVILGLLWLKFPGLKEPRQASQKN